MTRPKKIGAEGLALIKRFEGLELTAYKDIVGVWTIGYGHTGQVKAGMVITEAEAETLLRRDLEYFQALVYRRVTVDLNQNEFDALVSLAFNIGPGSAQKIGFNQSTLLRILNAGAPRAEVMLQFLRWGYAGGKLVPGLVRRRKAEAALFMKPVE